MPYDGDDDMPSSPPPDRYEPLPSVLALPGFLLRKLPPRRRRGVIAVGLVVLIALVTATLLRLPEVKRTEMERARMEERATQVAAAARRVRLSREARPRTGGGPAAAGLRPNQALRARGGLMARVEASVLDDARIRYRKRGPYTMSMCYTIPKGIDQRPPQDDLSLPIARVECLAVEKAFRLSERSPRVLIGQPFRARVDFLRGRYAWCKIEESPGEGLSGVLEPVAVPSECGGDS